MFNLNSNNRVLTLKMMDDSGEIVALDDQTSNLKLQLNQCQQVIASLELQLRQKEEVVIKAVAESMQCKQELKLLRDKCAAKSELKTEDKIKELTETIEEINAREKKLLDQINKLTKEESGFTQVMEKYEEIINQQISEAENMKRESDTANKHLAAMEIGFSDLHQKYERSKGIIEGYKNNEETLQQSLVLAHETIKKNEEKYESLKAHAKAQIDRSNKELSIARTNYQTEMHKLTAIVKHLEIKTSSLENALDQKIKECSALAALCDEVTGRVG